MAGTCKYGTLCGKMTLDGIKFTTLKQGVILVNVGMPNVNKYRSGSFPGHPIRIILLLIPWTLQCEILSRGPSGVHLYF